MKWREIQKVPERKPKKKGQIIKPQFLEDLLILDIYDNGVREVRYVMDVSTGEHGYQKEGERWKTGKLATACGGDANADYRYYGYPFDFSEMGFDSKHEKTELIQFLVPEAKNHDHHRWDSEINWKEIQYDREQRWEKEKRRAKRIENLISQIPKMPYDIREWIYEKAAGQEYAFYNKKKDKWGCTCCGAQVDGKKLKSLGTGKRATHNRKVLCPKCGKELTAKTRTDTITVKTGLYLINEVNEEASVIRYADVTIGWEYGRHTVEVNEVIQIMAYKKGVNKRRKKDMQLYYEQYGAYGVGNPRNKRAKEGYLYPGNFEAALSNTVYADGVRTLEQLAAAGQYLNYNGILIGIEGFAGYATLTELLFKGRFHRLLRETIKKTDWWGPSYYGSLTINGASLEEVFGIRDRQKINRIREHDGGEEMVRWLQYADKENKKIPQETLEYMIEHKITPKDFTTQIPQMSIQQVHNYIEKQRAAGYRGKSPKEVLEQWLDYLSMCRAQGKDMGDAMVYRPKDLKLRHDQAVTNAQKLRIVKEMGKNQEFRTQEAKKMREKYPRAEENLNAIRERYEYQNREYRIIVPNDLVEIIEEGQALHHCAGATERYFDRIEARETYICFLRRTEEPGIPYYTIEVEPSGTIRQHRSYMDEEPGIEQIRGFLKEWQQVLRKRLTEEDKKLARISKQKREENIAELKEKNNIRVLKGLAEDFLESPMELEAVI